LLSPEFLQRLERLELVSRRVFRGQLKGERRSPRKGQSVEFADYRTYVPGDDLRFIDWNSYARLDRLFLKLFLEEEDLRFYLLIDNSRSMTFGDPTKLQYAQSVAAALGFIGLTHTERVKIHVLGDTIPRAPLRGRRSVWQLFSQLESIEPAGETDLASGIKRFTLHNPGRGVVVLLSDLLDKQGYADALRYFTARQFDVYLIHILSAEELEPTLTGDLRLIDAEDAEETEITVSAPLLRRYRETLSAFVAGARDYCHRRGMVYLLANNQIPFEQLVTRYLRQRGLVR
jgi:uncharacterized protein (DUF58 family)